MSGLDRRPPGNEIEHESRLFSPFRLRGLTLRNRIVVSPMCQYSGVSGEVQPWHLMHIGGFAKSNPGLVIMEATAIAPEGRTNRSDIALYTDLHEHALARLIKDVRSFSNTPLGIQLNHSGRKASSRKLATNRRKAAPLPILEGGWSTVSASPIPYGELWPAPVELDIAGLCRVKEQWAAATRRAARAGFDLLEIHAAHGYLLASFFSPISNHRTDDYGGSVERRMRFPLEVMAACRAAWPDERPIGVRINGSDWVEAGITIDDAVTFARGLVSAGADYIVASAGAMTETAAVPPLVPGYMASYARALRTETGVPTMAVGLIVDPNFAEALLQDGTADLIAVGRAFLDDPNWTYHAAQVLGVDHLYERAYANIGKGWPGRAIASWWRPAGEYQQP